LGWKWFPWYILSTLLCKNMTPNALRCILLIILKYLKFVNNSLRRSPRSMKGSQHLALAHWKWDTPGVEKLSKALSQRYFVECLCLKSQMGQWGWVSYWYMILFLWKTFFIGNFKKHCSRLLK
jgi:hypothetical protein